MPLVWSFTAWLSAASVAAGAEPEPSPTPPDKAPSEPAPPADDAGWIDLSVPVDFGSAVDGPVRPEPGDPEAPDLAALRQPLKLRGRFSIKPWLGFIGLGDDDGGYGGTAGGVLGHQWWSLTRGVARPAGETRLRVVAPFGQLKGWEAELDSTAGVWIGPIGLLGGVALRGERLLWKDGAELVPALTLGPQLRLAAEVGPITPWVAATPAWRIAGDRAVLSGPWDEAKLEAGLGFELRPVGFRLSGTGTWTTVGVTWEAAVALQLRLF